MTILNPPAYLQTENDHSAASFRRGLAAIAPIQGPSVPQPAYLQVGPRGAGANISVDVAPGVGCVPDNGTVLGLYAVSNDAVENLPLAIPDTQDRIDVIGIRVLDSADNGPDLDNLGRFEVITGTPSGSPVAPSIPADFQFLPLAEVLVAANSVGITAGDITDLRNINTTANDLIPQLDAATALATTASADAANAVTTANTAQSTADAASAAAATADSTANGAVTVNGTQNTRLDDLEAATITLTQNPNNANNESVTEVEDDVVRLDANVRLEVQTNAATLGENNSAAVVWEMNGTDKPFRYETSSGDIALGFNGVTGFVSARTGTSTASTNMLRASTAGGSYGQIQVTSSSERFKHSIEDLDTDEALRVIRALRVITYRSKEDKPGGVDAGIGTQYGFSAEQTAEVHPGLAAYDAEGLPSGVDERGINAHLLLVVRDLLDRVDALEAQLGA